MDFIVDGEPVDFSQKWTYKGLAYSDVPNLVSTFGYINASWTLRADITSEFVCRLLNHMTETGTNQCTPRLRPEDQDMPQRPWIDDFSSGYMQRMMPMLPRQGDRAPWLNTQSYSEDKKLIRKGAVDDGVMQFTTTGSPPLRPAPAVELAQGLGVRWGSRSTGPTCPPAHLPAGQEPARPGCCA